MAQLKKKRSRLQFDLGCNFNAALSHTETAVPKVWLGTHQLMQGNELGAARLFQGIVFKNNESVCMYFVLKRVHLSKLHKLLLHFTGGSSIELGIVNNFTIR